MSHVFCQVVIGCRLYRPTHNLECRPTTCETRETRDTRETRETIKTCKTRETPETPETFETRDRPVTDP